MLKSGFWDGIWPETLRFGRRGYRKLIPLDRA
ncbi:unnamed protein product, partial [Rotaria sp. Silwood1]